LKQTLEDSGLISNSLDGGNNQQLLTLASFNTTKTKIGIVEWLSQLNSQQTSTNFNQKMARWIFCFWRAARTANQNEANRQPTDNYGTIYLW
jgi:hypothetical protein